ncbi:MAG: LysE family transporter [Candidatus Bathyarchaeota archaeon]|nr:LysE family transporter [Candidatus Bathyarchaeota archaeon]
MNPLNFAVTVIILSISGALYPGPLFFVTISHGIKSGTKSGIIFSIAHSLVEFTLVMLLALGLLSVANEPTAMLVVGVAGGVALIVFGAMQIRGSFSYKSDEPKAGRGATRSLLLIGLALTGLNPYFIVWWLTIGANLIFISLEFAGLVGVVFMYVCHVWVDYAWLTLVAALANRGAKILRFKWYRVLMAVFGVVLIYFGLSFLIDSLSF